jgi:hypothetical protein
VRAPTSPPPARDSATHSSPRLTRGAPAGHMLACAPRCGAVREWTCVARGKLTADLVQSSHDPRHSPRPHPATSTPLLRPSQLPLQLRHPAACLWACSWRWQGLSLWPAHASFSADEPLRRQQPGSPPRRGRTAACCTTSTWRRRRRLRRRRRRCLWLAFVLVSKTCACFALLCVVLIAMAALDAHA